MIIDFHVHIFRKEDMILDLAAPRLATVGLLHGVKRSAAEIAAEVGPLIDDPTGEVLIQSFNKAGIDVGVCFPLDDIGGCSPDIAMARNKRVAELAKRHPSRIIPFASIDPRRPRAADLLRTCIEELGMKGLKLHPDRGCDPTGRETYKVLEVLQAHNGILLSHTGTLPPPSRSRLAHPVLLDDVSCDFPNLRIVAAHAGGLWRKDWAAIAAYNDNIWGDLAEWQLDAAAHYDRFCRNLRELLDVVGSSKLVFATDWPALEPFMSSKEFIEAIRRLPKHAPPGMQFTSEEVDAMLGGNAQRILGI